MKTIAKADGWICVDWTARRMKANGRTYCPGCRKHISTIRGLEASQRRQTLEFGLNKRRNP